MSDEIKSIAFFHSNATFNVKGKGIIKRVDALKGCNVSGVKALCGKNAIIDGEYYKITGVELSSGLDDSKVSGTVGLIVRPIEEEQVMTEKLNPMRKYTLREIQAMPVVRQSQYDDVLFESERFRVWRSNMTIEDGAPYNNQITVEECMDGRWVIVMQYEPQIEVEPYPDPVYLRELLIEVESQRGCPFRFWNSVKYPVCNILYTQSLHNPVVTVGCFGIDDKECPLYDNEKITVKKL